MREDHLADDTTGPATGVHLAGGPRPRGRYLQRQVTVMKGPVPPVMRVAAVSPGA